MYYLRRLLCLVLCVCWVACDVNAETYVAGSEVAEGSASIIGIPPPCVKNVGGFPPQFVWVEPGGLSPHPQMWGCAKVRCDAEHNHYLDTSECEDGPCECFYEPALGDCGPFLRTYGCALNANPEACVLTDYVSGVAVWCCAPDWVPQNIAVCGYECTVGFGEPCPEGGYCWSGTCFDDPPMTAP